MSMSEEPFIRPLVYVPMLKANPTTGLFNLKALAMYIDSENEEEAQAACDLQDNWSKENE